MNKYSELSISYGFNKKEWRNIKKEVESKKMTSSYASEKFGLNSKQLWFLYDVLLQEKYNDLYKREKLVSPKVGDYVYVDDEMFGRGEIIKMLSSDLMLVKFTDRTLPTMCSSKTMTTVHDDIKRKITKL